MTKHTSLLQRFFDASLIPADTGDERLEHYQKAATSLASRFEKNLVEASSAVRVAIDPQCPPSDPWFEVVQEAVKEHWKTFLLNHHDAPRQVCRGILLEALVKAAQEELTVSHVIWYSTASLLPHLGTGPEQAITRELIEKFGRVCEEDAAEKWQLAAAKFPVLEAKLPSLKVGKLDEVELTKGLSDAAGPHDGNSQNHGSPNPYWPNQGAPWSHQFAPRAAKTIATEINKVLGGVATGLKGVADQLDPALTKFGVTVGKLVADSVARSERYTELVWWKQSLYSPGLKRSYRELSPTEMVVALTHDLAAIAPAPVPLSVEFFMRETLMNLTEADARLTLAEFRAGVKASSLVRNCLPAAPANDARRVSLPELLALDGHVTGTVIAHIGVKDVTALSLGDWAVWLLREHLAADLAAE